MKERPMLFSGEMVRAILDGRKTQTRRPHKGNPENVRADLRNYIPCPFGQVRDHLWVRETFCLEHQVERDQCPPFDDGRPLRWEYEGVECDPEGADTWIQPHYRATDPTPELCYEDTDGEPTVRWEPSIHMPRWASRITLEITDVRIQRIAEISNEDCVAEGIPRFPTDSPDYEKIRFFDLWDSLYAKKGFGFDANPWVWAITFKRIGG